MSEMIERVARALLFDRAGQDLWDVVSDEGDGYGYLGKNDYIALARAAIEAMREPTMVMGVAADCTSPQTPADNIWRAMIDEALK